VLYLEAEKVLSGAVYSDSSKSQGLFEFAARPTTPITSPPLRIRPGLTFHLYTSSVPCGNAALRRWAKPPPRDEEAALGKFAEGVGGWPLVPHPRLQVHARNEGQVSGGERENLCRIKRLVRAMYSRFACVRCARDAAHTDPTPIPTKLKCS
jgi:hypothetical protein